MTIVFLLLVITFIGFNNKKYLNVFDPGFGIGSKPNLLASLTPIMHGHKRHTALQLAATTN